MPALTLGPGLSPAAAAAATAAGGMGLTASNTLVATTLQQHIPLSVLSRVSAYDCTASCAYIPLAPAVAGPSRPRGPAQLPVAAGVFQILTDLAPLATADVRHLGRHHDTDHEVTGRKPGT